MTPTERAIELQPKIRDVLANIEQFVQPQNDFDPSSGTRMYRVMASDYVECTLLPLLTDYLRDYAPGITLDVLTPSDVGFRDVEQGKVDMVINRFEDMPLSFHQTLSGKIAFPVFWDGKTHWPIT
jgi:DNA-binding transcriptional LysR family regulator